MNTLEYRKGIFGSAEAVKNLKERDESKIIIASDSHGNSAKLLSIFEEYVASADAFLFAGDGLEDLLNIIREAYMSPDLRAILPPVIAAVSGNCDGSVYKMNTPFTGGKNFQQDYFEFLPFIFLKASGKKIFLTHGHMFGVELGIDIFSKTAPLKDCEAAVYGHTHIQKAEMFNKILFVNPGSLTLPRGNSKAGFAVMTLSKTQPSKISFSE